MKLTRQPAEAGGPDDPRDVLRRFDEGLARDNVDVELCVVGGAVLALTFPHAPQTRRPEGLFASGEASLRARRRAAEASGVALDRLEDAARRLVGGGPDGPTTFEGERLRVLAPPADYLLAMKCAALRFGPDSSVGDDIRYLLRYLGVREPHAALDAVSPYLGPRQRPEDLEAKLAAILR